MTLVLPYCSEEKRLLFEPIGSMPCVYEGEPLDFESALMSGEWPTLKDIATEYEQNDDNKATSDLEERSPSKRKLISDECGGAEDDGASEAKKVCPTTNYSTSPMSFANESSNHVACSVQEVPVTDEDDDQYPPRRRGPQMWNFRQRWKDERKKVLKMSVGKLTEIEDPELWLLRSVLINNTIKRLHQDIRNERQAKMRHRQLKVDCYHQERYDPVPSTPTPTNIFEDKKSSSSDIYDDTSCDEIFGINEDFLRVNIPDRRMSSSPIPPTNPVQVVDKDCTMDVDPSSSTECDTTASPIAFANRTQTTTTTNGQQQQQQQRHLGAASGSQCATQFRTNENDSATSFPPRVPILDSVVYHSLLASLESS